MSTPNSEIEEVMASMSIEDRELLNEILAEEDTSILASEGQAIVRQKWDTKSLVDKKINKAVMLIAKTKKDPMYDKFKKFFKLSRFWRAKLRDKYYGIARGIVMSKGGMKATDIAKAVHERLGK